MYICLDCKKQLVCTKNGVGADFGLGHIYPGDTFKCPKCGLGILATNSKPIFDPGHSSQDDYVYCGKPEDQFKNCYFKEE
jgi:hypothetical protein